MIRVFVAILLCLSVAMAFAASGDLPKSPVPFISTVDHGITRAGATLIANGTLLDKSAVASLYMIQGESTIEVKIVSQTEEAIKFIVPDSVKAGKYNLMVLTKGAVPQYIEEPVLLVIE
jgi:hypothetical protein